MGGPIPLAIQAEGCGCRDCGPRTVDASQMRRVLAYAPFVRATHPGETADRVVRPDAFYGSSEAQWTAVERERAAGLVCPCGFGEHRPSQHPEYQRFAASYPHYRQAWTPCERSSWDMYWCVVHDDDFAEGVDWCEASRAARDGAPEH